MRGALILILTSTLVTACGGTQPNVEDVLSLRGAEVKTTHEDDDWTVEATAKTTVLNLVPLDITTIVDMPMYEGKRLVCWVLLLNGQFKWLPPTADNDHPVCRQRHDAADVPLRMSPEELSLPCPTAGVETAPVEVEEPASPDPEDGVESGTGEAVTPPPGEDTDTSSESEGPQTESDNP